ncbi:MAG: (Fe-S)-binding protein [Promethearchaeota archaeon]
MAKVTALQVYKFLPKTNCKKCGKPSCMAFAISLLKGDATPDKCAEFNDPKFRGLLPKLVMLLEPLRQEKKTNEGHIEVDEDKCDGCGLCVVACPVNSRHEPRNLSGKAAKHPASPEVLYRVVDGKCKLVKLQNCRRYDPGGGDATNCTVCETYCPRGAIKIYQ